MWKVGIGCKINFYLQLIDDEGLSHVVLACPTTSILTESNLHSRVLQTKLTPKLGPLIPIIRDELDYAVAEELPHIGCVYCLVRYQG